ncbi:MAG: tetratricopeptide repeat protein [Candidatus Viridilinea halotolerans]|uniref:Tetratricopeptide repeat protein n=1 Tax=Candidatus Viridilinea halotolerans TaxID=2491704 RepID=A0A426U193_9CHLR|nr:MAG: tetratricopeptide repeat protein [Candidatus Viridilinea halotolerans]
MTASVPVFPDPADEIGQSAALNLVEQVIRSFASASAVYHILGDGGIGKSHLLGVAQRAVQEDHKQRNILRLASGVIDLADTRYQHPLWLMQIVAKRISTLLQNQSEQRGLFNSFDQQVERYIRTQGAHFQSGEGLSSVRDAFLLDYNQIARHYPIVLTIDTFERLDPRIPDVEAYNFRPANRLERWLLDLINDLDNTLTFIAGRIQKRQVLLLTERLGAKLARRLLLQPFTPAETQAYMEARGEQPHDLAWYQRMYEVSGGHPVRLIVALEIARAVQFDPDHLPPSFTQPHPTTTQKLGQDFSATYMKALYEQDQTMARLIEQAVFLRKGLYPSLLQHLAHAGGDESASEEMPALLQRLQAMAFVKHAGDNMLSLHDEIYDMLTQHVSQASIDGWYQHTIEHLEAAIKRLNVEIEREGLTVERLAQLRSYQIHRLYYKLARTPNLSGYQDYCELVYSSILGYDEDFDIQIQDEFARFFDARTVLGKNYRQQLALQGLPWERLVCDEAVRWVFRRIHSYTSESSNRNEEALALADRVAQDFAQVLAEDPLAACSLEVARLEAAGLLWREPEQMAVLRERYTKLTQTLRAITQRPIDSDLPLTTHTQQQARFFLAYALNNWGYLERVRQRLKTAANHYREAISLYKTLGPETTALRATTLNNLAFALKEQGELELALRYAQRVVQIQRTVGHRYREAAAHLTTTNICLDLDNILAAQQHVEHAKLLLQEFPNSRFAALCARTEGELYRWLGWVNYKERSVSEEQFAHALACYQTALSLLGTSGERERIVEIYKGLGCTYRNRGHARFRRHEDGAADMDEARAILAQALVHCPRGLPLQADIMEDIGVTYVYQRRFVEARQQLLQAAQAVPAEYTIGYVPTEATTTPTDEVQQFWLQRAQIDLQLAICALGLEELDEAGDRLLRAFTALYRFSPGAHQQINTFRTVTRDYTAGLRDPARIKKLRHATYLRSQRLQAREAFFELNRIFLQAEEIAELLD